MKIKRIEIDNDDIVLIFENGRKLEIRDFIKEFNEYSLEVVDELYGFNQVEYSGYITLSNSQNLIQFSMSFYYTGDLIYITEE